jgi:hypothetical protein
MNSFTTKQPLNWFELRTTFRRADLRPSPAKVIWILPKTPMPRTRFWPGTISASQRAGDFWETLTYTVLWFCGLFAIGICCL